MYTYIIQGENLKVSVSAPWLSDMSPVKTEPTQTPEKITMRATYPNGVVLEIVQEATQATICSNRQLIQNEDGSYSVPE